MKTATLRSNALWNIAGTVAYTGSMWGILIAFAKLGNPRMVGQIALGLAISTPVFFFTNLGLRQVLATDARGEFSTSVYVRTRLVGLTVGVAVVWLLGSALSGATDTWRVVALIGLGRATESFSDLCYGLFQRIERFTLVARSMILRGTASVGLVVLGLQVSSNVEVPVALWVASWFAVTCVHDLPLFLRYRAAHVVKTSRTMPELFSIALPLGIAGMLIALNLNIPRYLIAHFHGETMLGIFAAIMYVPGSARRILESIAQAVTPRLAGFWADGHFSEYRRLLLRLLAIGAGCGVLGIVAASLAGGDLLSIAYTQEYAAYQSLFVWLMVSWTLRYIGAFLISGIVAARRFRPIPKVFAPSVLAGLIGGAILIPRYGLMGAAWTTLFSASVQIGMTFFWGRDLLLTRRSY